MTINKVWPSPAAAVADISDGAAVAIAGFGLTQGFPTSLTLALREHGASGLCVVANSLGDGPYRSSALVENRQVSRLIVCFSTRAGAGISAAEVQITAGEIEVELVGQGTLVERLRAGGAGIGAFYTRTGVGTALAVGKETRDIDGIEHVLEYGLQVDYALICAKRADRFGNLQFEGAGRNFMPSFAKGARIAIAEVEEIVDGALDPEKVSLPGIFVSRVVQRTVEVPIVFPRPRAGREADRAQSYNGKVGWTRNEMAKVAASLLPAGSYVNLGLGIPALVSNHVAGRDITLHSENGMLGYGALATEDSYDPMIYNASAQYVQLAEGASFFDSATSFEMIRGGRVDVVVLGAFQVDESASLANWATPEMAGGAIGGAMDMVAGGGTVMVLMLHHDSKGRPKLVSKCSYPLTGVGCVDIVVTDLGVFRYAAGRFRLEQTAPGFDAQEIAQLTELDFDY
jgi:3-oxoacid CoA-transferase